MNHLSTLKPAETLLLLDGFKADFKSLLKYTFMDLVLKQVLVVKESVKTYNSGRRVREQRIKYVIKGKNFNNYKFSPFELIYLSTFQKSPEINAILIKLVKVAYEAIDTEKTYRKTILNSSPIKHFFKTSFLDLLFGTFSLTAEGKAESTAVQVELAEIDRRIGQIMKDNPKEALELLIKIGGNIFLLKNLDFELLRKIDTTILQSMKIDRQFDSYNNDSGWWYYLDFSDTYWLDSTFDSWDTTFDSFDSGYDAAGCSSHDSGCSSCSGCSGCGGCGGCN